MKALALRLAIVIGFAISFTIGIFSYPADARNHTSDSAPQTSQQRIPPDSGVSNREAVEINFAVRTFLWALDHRRPEILAKIASPQMLAEFPNAQMLLLTMTRVHRPVIGARHTFLHLPTVNNGTAIQVVYLQGTNGSFWKATYMLSREKSGRYGVFGCIVTKLQGKFS